MEIEQRISELEEIISGTIKSKGAYNSTNRKWEINYSSILTKLILEAGRWCENYASDLFIQWYYNIENPLKNGLIKDEQITFAFRKNGVDHNEWYQNNKNDINYYRAVWFLDIKIMGDKMEMILHK